MKLNKDAFKMGITGKTRTFLLGEEYQHFNLTSATSCQQCVVLNGKWQPIAGALDDMQGTCQYRQAGLQTIESLLDNVMTCSDQSDFCWSRGEE